MRIASTCVVALALALCCAELTACSSPVPTQTTRRAGTNNGRSSQDTTGTTDDELTPVESEPGEETTEPTPAETDSDGDGIPDATDCDPASAALAGTRLLDDALAVDKGYFGAPDGFPQASWAYDSIVYRQTRVVDAADASFFLEDSTIGDVIAEVRTASTEVAAAITPRLRQMFIVVGATVSGGQLSALGCGIEVVQGEATEQKTSVVRLTGGPGAVTTTTLQRVNRAAVQIDEELAIKARLAQGTLTCEVTNGGVTTTATASGLGTPTGSVGFFTRQTKALFKQARICKLK